MGAIKCGSAPAFPVTLHNRTEKAMAAWEGVTIDAGGSVTYGGLTEREYAAILLRVPDSGAEWLDDMIRRAQRDELAAKADASVFMPFDTYHLKYGRQPTVAELARYVAELRYAAADAMLAAREGRS